jgi:hypothetical protein
VIAAVRERTDNLVGIKVSDSPFAAIEPYLGTGLDVFIGAEPCIREGLERGAVGASPAWPRRSPRRSRRSPASPPSDNDIAALRAELEQWLGVEALV